MRTKTMLAVLLAMGGAVTLAARQGPEINAQAKAMVGQTLWVRIDIVRIQYLFNATDVTNIFRDGSVKYQARLNLRRTESNSVEEFTRDVQRTLQQNGTVGNVRVLNRGARVVVKSVKPEGSEVEVEVKDNGNTEHRLRFKFDDGRYTIDDFKRLWSVAFANSEAEATGTATIRISLGMTVEEVIAAKGPAKTRVDLGTKTVLTYSDMKLIFENGKLVDVQ